MRWWFIIFLFLSGIGCSRRDEAPSPGDVVSSKEVSDAASAPAEVAPAEVATAEVATDEPKPPLETAPDSASPSDDTATLDTLASEPVSDAIVLSKRSLSLKVSFKNGRNAVFKPMRKDNGTARHEVAFYRYSRLIGVPGVPPSTVRRLPFALLERMVGRRDPETALRMKEELQVDGAGQVAGAIIHWMEDLSPSGLEGTDGLLSAILEGSHRDHPLSAGVAGMVALDFTGGNWDRFSGGNLFATEGGTKLALIDNNNSFSRLSEGQLARLERVTSQLKWLPPRVLQALRTLNAEQIAQAMVCEECALTLLYSGEIERVLERRDALLSRQVFDPEPQAVK